VLLIVTLGVQDVVLGLGVRGSVLLEELQALRRDRDLPILVGLGGEAGPLLDHADRAGEPSLRMRAIQDQIRPPQVDCLVLPQSQMDPQGQHQDCPFRVGVLQGDGERDCHLFGRPVLRGLPYDPQGRDILPGRPGYPPLPVGHVENLLQGRDVPVDGGVRPAASLLHPDSGAQNHLSSDLFESDVSAKVLEPVGHTDRVALSADTRSGSLRPLMSRCLRHGETIHASWVKQLGEGARHPIVSGRSVDGEPLTGHRHAHLLPLRLLLRSDVLLAPI